MQGRRSVHGEPHAQYISISTATNAPALRALTLATAPSPRARGVRSGARTKREAHARGDDASGTGVPSARLRAACLPDRFARQAAHHGWGLPYVSHAAAVDGLPPPGVHCALHRAGTGTRLAASAGRRGRVAHALSDWRPPAPLEFAGAQRAEDLLVTAQPPSTLNAPWELAFTTRLATGISGDISRHDSRGAPPSRVPSCKLTGVVGVRP
ncbi:hypothetical protein PsYK624_150470 [Phanerochaete sordida]|uniref:Uncharacterized protein n=1 Tax=Phanerochaete sordida TaxID=48140 RepID=A0A9P3GNN1_9APHY|nr:hypothetical protein PsYK624_150470 [Phanerochaete sordida]